MAEGVKFKVRRASASAWASANPVLLLGEPALETDTSKTKNGDGVSAWNDLPYNKGNPEWGDIGGTLSDQTDLQAALALKADLAASRGGPLANGVWVKLPAIYRLLLDGTGTVTIDTRTRDGTVTSSAASYPSVSGEATEYPYFGDDAYEVRASLTGSATAEIV